VYLRGISLRHANLEGAYLSEANLEQADLAGANLEGAELVWGVNLSGANLNRAVLEDALLPGANLMGAVLTRASLRGAYLQGAYLFDADLTGADLSGADLRNAGVTRSQLAQAASISFTIYSSAEVGSHGHGIEHPDQALNAREEALGFWSWLSGCIGGVVATILHLGCSGFVVWFFGGFVLFVILAALNQEGAAVCWGVGVFIVWLLVCTSVAFIYLLGDEPVIQPGVRMPPTHLRLSRLPLVLAQTPALFVGLVLEALRGLGSAIVGMPRFLLRVLNRVYLMARWILFVGLPWLVIGLATLCLLVVLLNSLNAWIPDLPPWPDDAFGSGPGADLLYLVSMFAWVWVIGELLIPVVALLSFHWVSATAKPSITGLRSWAPQSDRLCSWRVCGFTGPDRHPRSGRRSPQS